MKLDNNGQLMDDPELADQAPPFNSQHITIAEYHKETDSVVVCTEVNCFQWVLFSSTWIEPDTVSRLQLFLP